MRTIACCTATLVTNVSYAPPKAFIVRGNLRWLKWGGSGLSAVHWRMTGSRHKQTFDGLRIGFNSSFRRLLP